MTAGPVLVVFSGLPGTGKTTLARGLAARLGAAFLRIDEIEQALRIAGIPAVGPAGYAVANALAESNLRLGLPVVVDCVNPVQASRQGWDGVAARVPATLVNLLLVCTDTAEHRRRVECRVPDISGHVLPSWDQVTTRPFEPWEGDHVRIDTAGTPPAALVDRCVGVVSSAERSRTSRTPGSPR